MRLKNNTIYKTWRGDLVLVTENNRHRYPHWRDGSLRTVKLGIFLTNVNNDRTRDSRWFCDGNNLQHSQDNLLEKVHVINV